MGKIIESFEFRGDKGKANLSALLDSGASVSVIRKDAVDRLAGGGLRLPAKTLRMVNAKTWVKTSTVVVLSVRMRGKDLDGKFYVVKDLPREAIIGVDFLQAWEIRLDPKRHDFTVGLDPDAIEMASF